MKFSVTVNDSPRYIVNAKSPVGAVKVAFSAMSDGEDMPDANEELTITVKPLSKGERPQQEKRH
jgi:hypothetical protein